MVANEKYRAIGMTRDLTSVPVSVLAIRKTGHVYRSSVDMHFRYDTHENEEKRTQKETTQSLERNDVYV